MFTQVIDSQGEENNARARPLGLVLEESITEMFLRYGWGFQRVLGSADKREEKN